MESRNLPIRTQFLTVDRREQLSLSEVDLPEVKPNEVLVAVNACGICGSDLRSYRNGKNEHSYFGHEFSGTVAAVGHDVEDIHVGDRVASGLLRGCGKCAPCLLGHPNFCEKAQEPYFPGGFSDFCIVTCENNSRSLAPIPSDVDDLRATLHEPLACAMRITANAAVHRGNRILVLGLGMMGVLSGLLLKMSALEVEVIGGDMNSYRVDTCRELGLDECLQIGLADSRSAWRAHGSFDVVIDTTGAASTFPIALEMARLGGTVVLGGVPQDSIDFAPLPIFRKELTIRGAKGPFPFVNEGGQSLVMETLRSSDVPWDRLIRTFEFERAEQAFRLASGGQILKGVLSFSSR